MKTRREVLQILSAVTLAGAVSLANPLESFARTAPPASGIQLGAQTNAWAIDPKNPDSFFAVLDQVKHVGYQGFETGFFNLINQFDSPEETRRRIAATGLTFFGIHIAIPFDKDDPPTRLPPAALYEKVARGGQVLGAQRLLFSGAPSATPMNCSAR